MRRGSENPRPAETPVKIASTSARQKRSFTTRLLPQRSRGRGVALKGPDSFLCYGDPRQRRPRGGPGQPRDAARGRGRRGHGCRGHRRAAAAAGPGYLGEWGLFCDYTSATDQPALPTTVAALTGFLAALPARPATMARRVARSPPRTAAPAICSPAPTPGLLMIAACATRGWPAGLTGRRDAFLIVLTEILGYPHRAARQLRTADIAEPTTGPPGESVPCLQGRPVPSSGDPRTCPACALVRWVDILGVADGLGRGSTRMALAVADAPTPTGPHQHTPTEPARWRGAAVLLPAVDRHGWLDDYRPISTRTIRTRLGLASGRTGPDVLLTGPPDTPPAATNPAAATPATPPARPAHELDEVLTLLDDLADDADALNTRIQALLDDHHPSRRRG